jgi:hypothetical protein
MNAVLRKEPRQAVRPFDHGDPVGPEGFVEPEVGGFSRILDPVQVEMLDRGRTVVALAEDESRAGDGYIVSMQRVDKESDESRFPRAELARQRHRVARTQRLRKAARELSESIAVEKIQDVRGHALLFAESNRVLVRASDVVVGIIAGAVCAVVSAAFEGGILAFRFFSIDHLGGHFGAEFAVVAIAGAAIGGLVALGAGTFFRREPATR